MRRSSSTVGVQWVAGPNLQMYARRVQLWWNRTSGPVAPCSPISRVCAASPLSIKPGNRRHSHGAGQSACSRYRRRCLSCRVAIPDRKPCNVGRRDVNPGPNCRLRVDSRISIQFASHTPDRSQLPPCHISLRPQGMWSPTDISANTPTTEPYVLDVPDSMRHHSACTGPIFSAWRVGVRSPCRWACSSSRSGDRGRTRLLGIAPRRATG